MGKDADANAPKRSVEAPDPYEFASHYTELHDPKFYDQKITYFGGVHAYSTFFSHAAYLMMNNTDISDEMWTKVFYESLYNLNFNATFLDARHAVVAAAKKIGFNGGADTSN